MAKHTPMTETRFQPSVWREKAAEYLDKARSASDFGLRTQFTELAIRYLDIAEDFEQQATDSKWPK